MSTPLRKRLTIFKEILFASTLTQDTHGKQAVSRVFTALKFLFFKNGFDFYTLFSANFYLEKNRDVAEAKISPLAHYLRSGAKEGRDPHPLFSSSYYLERNPDVAENGINPLVHYICIGAKEGRDPHPLFSSSYYREQNPDVAEKGINPLVHYVGVGAKEGRDPHPIFDVAYYLERRPDLKQKEINPLIHYISFGFAEGQNPTSYSAVHTISNNVLTFEEKPIPSSITFVLGQRRGTILIRCLAALTILSRTRMQGSREAIRSRTISALASSNPAVLTL